MIKINQKYGINSLNLKLLLPCLIIWAILSLTLIHKHNNHPIHYNDCPACIFTDTLASSITTNSEYSNPLHHTSLLTVLQSNFFYNQIFIYNNITRSPPTI